MISDDFTNNWGDLTWFNQQKLGGWNDLSQACPKSERLVACWAWAGSGTSFAAGDRKGIPHKSAKKSGILPCFLGMVYSWVNPHHHETWQNAADIYIYIYCQCPWDRKLAIVICEACGTAIVKLLVLQSWMTLSSLPASLQARRHYGGRKGKHGKCARQCKNIPYKTSHNITLIT